MQLAQKCLNSQELIHFDPITWDAALYTIFRGLVRTGAEGAFAPAEIWQRVQCTRPQWDS